MKSSDFRFSRPFEIRWSDLDELHHVNNAVFLTYFEEGRTYYLDQVAGGKWDWFEQGSMILANASINFRSPLNYGENPVMHVKCKRLGSSSLELEYLISVKKGESEIPIAESTSILVFYDYTNAKSREIPASIRIKFNEFEGREF